MGALLDKLTVLGLRASMQFSSHVGLHKYYYESAYVGPSIKEEYAFSFNINERTGAFFAVLGSTRDREVCSMGHGLPKFQGKNLFMAYPQLRKRLHANLFINHLQKCSD